MQEQLLERIAIALKGDASRIALERLAGEKQDLGIFDAETIKQSTYIFGGGSDDIKKGVPWYILSDNIRRKKITSVVRFRKSTQTVLN